MSDPVFFRDGGAWRKWLEKNHAKASEIVLGIRKKSSGLPGIAHKDAVDNALAFGWIDGHLKSIDETAYQIRFTPRKKGSIWSVVNIKRVGELREAGLMHAAGIAVFEGRDLRKADKYTHEQGELEMPSADLRRLKANKSAHAFFEAQPKTYRRQCIWWLVSAKQEATRERRLVTLIEESAAGRRLKQFTSPVAAYMRSKGDGHG